MKKSFLLLILVGSIHSVQAEYSPLHDAIDSNDFVTAKSLIDQGANVNEQDNDGQTPLHYVCKNRLSNLDSIAAMIYYLVMHGANMSIKNARGHTPYYYLENNITGIRNYDMVTKRPNFDKNIIKRVFFGKQSDRNVLLAFPVSDLSSLSQLPQDVLNEIRKKLAQLSPEAQQLLKAEIDAANEARQEAIRFQEFRNSTKR